MSDVRPLVFVTAAAGREVMRDRLLAQLGDRFPVNVHFDTDLQGSLAPWLSGIKRLLVATMENALSDITHIVWLPDDAILVDGWHDAMLAAIASHPDDILCMYANHKDAAGLVGKASWYTTPDGFVGFAGTMPVGLWWEHLQWRETALKDPLADHRTRYGVANDEGVNLWAMATGRLIYKAVESLVDHDDSAPSLDGNDDHAFRRPATLAKDAASIDWTIPPVTCGRTYRGNHWNLIRKLSPNYVHHAKTIERAYELERLAPVTEAPSLAISTPAYEGAYATQYVTSLVRTVTAAAVQGLPFWYATGHVDSLICRGRNRLAHKFLKSDATHLLFIDSDLGWDAGDVIKLFRDTLSADEHVVGGVYPKKELLPDGSSPVVFNLRAEDRATGQVKGKGALCPVQDLGTGFMLISRKALIDVAYATLSTVRVSDFADELGETYFGWFDPFVDGERDLSEDYAFCRRWQRLGGTVYAHTEIDLTHTGNHVFRGSVRDTVSKEIQP